MQSLSLDVGGPVHVAAFGERGPTVLLVHGLGGSHANWLAAAPLLAERHRVFALDLPGFGLSPAAGRASSLPSSVRVIHQAIQLLGNEQPVILIGNSMGGLQSLGVAAAHPEHVAGLILVNAALPQPPGHGMALEPLLREYVFAYFPGLVTWRVRRAVNAAGPDELVNTILRACTAHFERIDPAVLQAHYEIERERVRHPGWHEPLQDALGSLLRALGQRSLIDGWITRITVPTLLLHGRSDRVVSYQSSASAADARPDWDFQVFDDVGHVPMLEAPAEFAGAVLSWLQRQPWSGTPGAPAPATLAAEA